VEQETKNLLKLIFYSVAFILGFGIGFVWGVSSTAHFYDNNLVIEEFENKLYGWERIPYAKTFFNEINVNPENVIRLYEMGGTGGLNVVAGMASDQIIEVCRAGIVKGEE